ncbi:MAG: response regulator [Myxococcota bacterium]|nr:response regulator [Myxococcota bacterium]
MIDTLRILVVDDSAAMRAVLVRTIRSFGWRTTFYEARDARQAVPIFRQVRPHLVITDWAMPGISGLELLRAFVRNGAQVPVGMVTGNASDDQRMEALRAGAAFVVTKPFSPAEIKKAIHIALDLPRPPAETNSSDGSQFSLAGHCIKAFGAMVDRRLSLIESDGFRFDGSVGAAIAYADADEEINFVIGLDFNLAHMLIRCLRPGASVNQVQTNRRFNPDEQNTLREIGNVFRGALIDVSGRHLSVAAIAFRGDGTMRNPFWRGLVTSMSFLSSTRYEHTIMAQDAGEGNFLLFELK